LIFFVRGLILEDGAATITDFTARLIANGIKFFQCKNKLCKILVCGGGRKNNIFIERIKNKYKN
jgi:anhydro-N-acetylmuramic acid kinase